jgi:hypothetical protein
MGESDETDRWGQTARERERREREGGGSLTGGARLSARRAARGAGPPGPQREGEKAWARRGWLGWIRPSRGGGKGFPFSFSFSNSFLFFFYFCFFLFLSPLNQKILYMILSDKYGLCEVLQLFQVYAYD